MTEHKNLPAESASRDSGLLLYEAAIKAIAAARSVDEVVHIRDQSQQMKLYARQAKDKTMMADAMEIQLRAERRLGQLLIDAKDQGQLSQGGRPRTAPATPAEKTASNREEVLQRVTLKEAGIDHKLSAASQKLAAVPQDAFDTVLERARDKIVSGGGIVVNPIKDLTTAEKKSARDGRAKDLAGRNRALPTVQCGIIYCDPAWDEEVWSDDTGKDRHAENHYTTMSLAEIQALDIASIAAPNCILFMWAKTNMLLEAFLVAEAYGFVEFVRDPDTGHYSLDKDRAKYVSAWAWVKNAFGNGRWVRDKHEHLLIFVRGRPVAPAPGQQLASAIEAAKTVHSAKPELWLDWIDLLWPDEMKIELNRRGPARPGWLAWGNEAEPEPERVPELSEYERLVDADQLRGRHTPATAEPIVRAAYASKPPIPEARLVRDLGHSRGTVSSWASRFGVGSRERQRDNAFALHAKGDEQ